MKRLYPDTPHPDHMRFRREMPHGVMPPRHFSFSDERNESHGWAWWLAGAGCAIILLALGFFA